MKRYYMIAEVRVGQLAVFSIESADGGWVLYADAEAELTRLRHDLSDMLDKLQKACYCPMCGKNSLTAKHGEYRFEPPDAIAAGAIVVPDATWYECGACHEQILPPELVRSIEQDRNRK